jgi:nitrite reductase/ring-hydroxylating ferredoxin subunit
MSITDQVLGTARRLARRTEHARREPLQRYPFPPFPRGWYAVAFSEELRAKEVRTVRFLGRDLVLWRGESGQAVAMDPYCPHLGAHLGVGGEVVGDSLRCPMHHFCFDGAGACVSTPYGTKLPSGRAPTLPLVERGGFLFLRHDPDNVAPDWELPEIARDEWGPSTTLRFTMHTHVQDIAENTVDVGHFGPTHGYSAVEALDPVRTEPNHLLSRYALTRSANIFGRATGKFRVELSINLHGLGLYVIDGITEPGFMRTRHIFAATPVEENEIAFRIRIWVKDIGKAARVSGVTRLLPSMVHKLALLQMIRLGVLIDVGQDVRILDRKRYVERPSLAQGDGRFSQFRAWAKQFYAAPQSGPAPADPSRHVRLALIDGP